MEFVQESIATLHAFDDPIPPVSRERIAVVVPIMGEDLSRPSVEHVLDELARYDPGRVVLCVRSGAAAVIDLRHRLEAVNLDADLLWCNAPTLETALDSAGIDRPAGKGMDVWLGMGIGAATHDVVVVHDADSRAFGPELVSRLAWPILNGYQFTKGYYARIEQSRLYGRLVRLIWYPLIDALQRNHEDAILDYLGGFRYPLAGEFALHADVLEDLQVYPQWGLEAGMLGHMFTIAGTAGSAQADLGVHYHDHRPVHGDSGLACIADGVLGALFDVLDERGIDIDLASITSAYERIGQTYLDRYEMDAAFNGLTYDRAEELAQLETYARSIRSGGSRAEPLPPFAAFELDAAELLTEGTPPAEPADPRRSP